MIFNFSAFQKNLDTWVLWKEDSIFNMQASENLS